MRTLTREGGDRIYGSEEHGVAVDEAGRVAELQHRQTFLVVQARLVHADVVVEWKDLVKML